MIEPYEGWRKPNRGTRTKALRHGLDKWGFVGVSWVGRSACGALFSFSVAADDAGATGGLSGALCAGVVDADIADVVRTRDGQHLSEAVQVYRRDRDFGDDDRRSVRRLVGSGRWRDQGRAVSGA